MSGCKKDCNAICCSIEKHKQYEQGRADMKKEIEEHSVFYSNRPIEDIVFEARANAIDECLEIVADVFISCRTDDVSWYEVINETRKRLKEQR